MNIPFDFIDFLGYEKRPFRAKFIPRVLLDKLDDYQYDVLNLENLLGKYRIVVLNKPATERYEEYWVYSGEYDSESNRIIITTCGNLSVGDTNVWCNFKFNLLKTIMHEMIHQYQYLKRDEQDILGDYEYHNHPDEIHAYAHCMYLELSMNNFMMTVKDLINEPESSDTYMRYQGKESLPDLLKWVVRWQRKYENALLNHSNQIA